MLQIAPDAITIDDGTDFLHLAATGLTVCHVDLKHPSQHPRPRVILVDTRVCRFILLGFTGFSGTYGDYILGKVAKVFPDLFATYLHAKAGK